MRYIFSMTAGRLKDFIVSLTNTLTAVKKPTIDNTNVCYRYSGVPPDQTFTVACEQYISAGRYLVIQLPITEYLNINEVEVYGNRKYKCSFSKITFHF